MRHAGGGAAPVAATFEPPDIETSSDDYADRFAGPTGEWMLRVQERIVLDFLAGRPGARILDVGGGHGQLAGGLSREGYDVTVIGSAASCRSRIAHLIEAGRCEFVVGNLERLPWSGGSFDVVLAFRLLTHWPDWPRLVVELCKVAREAVIVDFPTSQSLNIMAPLFFDAKKRVEGNTRDWRLFRKREVRDEFVRRGFPLRRQRGQFVLPMVFHRMLGLPAVSATLEASFGYLGLSRLWGSPVIAEFVRDRPGSR